MGARVDAQIYQNFKAYTREHKGHLRGELGRMLDRAMLEYMDQDRNSRIEDDLAEILERLDTLADDQTTHTHTPMQQRESSAKLDLIERELARMDTTVIHDDAVVGTIEDVAGIDPRTIEKYKRQLKRQGIAYKHPSGTVWTPDATVWAGWVESHVDNDPTAELMDILLSYPIGLEEYEALVEGEEVVYE